jgi:hypothetical protein
MSQGSILFGALFFAFLKKERKRRKGRNGKGCFFPPGLTCPIVCIMLGLFWLLGEIKSCFKGQLAVIILETSRITQV